MAQRYGVSLRRLLSLVAGMAVGLLAAGGTSGGEAAPPMVAVGLGVNYEFVSLWPALPQDWYFNQPTGVATDKAGNIYVVHGFNCIQKLSPSGQCLAKWGTTGSGDGQFQGLQGIAVDAAGNIYVTERGNRRVQVLSPDGKFLRTWGGSGKDEVRFDTLNRIRERLQDGTFPR